MRTIAQAITDLATKAKGSQAVPRGRKITDALDALADAMAGTDVPLANCTTIVNAIDTVTANYGGGGVDVGSLVPAPLFYNGQGKPQVGAILGTGQGGGSLMSQPANLSIGGTQIATLATMTCAHYGSWQIGTVAAGMTVTIQNVPTGMTIGLASVTVDDLAASSPEITAVEDFDGFTIDGTDLIIEMPELGTNGLLLIYAS